MTMELVRDRGPADDSAVALRFRNDDAPAGRTSALVLPFGSDDEAAGDDSRRWGGGPFPFLDSAAVVSPDCSFSNSAKRKKNGHIERLNY
jgi:hypothetical protein